MNNSKVTSPLALRIPSKPFLLQHFQKCTCKLYRGCAVAAPSPALFLPAVSSTPLPAKPASRASSAHHGAGAVFLLWIFTVSNRLALGLLHANNDFPAKAK